MRNMMVRLYSRCKKYGSSGLAMMMAVLFTMPAYASESGGDVWYYRRFYKYAYMGNIWYDKCGCFYCQYASCNGGCRPLLCRFYYQPVRPYLS